MSSLLVGERKGKQALWTYQFEGETEPRSDRPSLPNSPALDTLEFASGDNKFRVVPLSRWPKGLMCISEESSC